MLKYLIKKDFNFGLMFVIKSYGLAWLCYLLCVTYIKLMIK